MCSLLGSYDHLVTTLTYEKDIVNFDVITATHLSHSRRRKNVDEGNQGEGLYVKVGHDHGQSKVNSSSRNKKSKSNNRKTTKCYTCKQIRQ